MAYEKNTWKTGDIVTSAKLNHIEEGIENTNVPVFYVTDETKTADAIAFLQEYPNRPFFIQDDNYGLMTGVFGMISEMPSSPNGYFNMAAFCYDGIDLTFVTYRPDPEEHQRIMPGAQIVALTS